MEILEARIIMAEEVKGKLLTNGFIPSLKNKKVVIRLVSGGQPVTGTIEGYNPNEAPPPDSKRAAFGIQACYSLNRACG